MNLQDNNLFSSYEWFCLPQKLVARVCDYFVEFNFLQYIIHKHSTIELSMNLR